MKYIKKSNKRGDGEQYKELTCPICKNTFTRRLTEYNFWNNNGKNRTFYCSKKCCSLSITKYGTQHCTICNKDIPTSQHRGHKMKYCSRKCYDIGQTAERENTTCLNCGTIFKTRHIEHRRFCSRDCSFKYSGETSIEKKVREELNKRNIFYETQKPFKGFYLDFLLPNKVVIECDGEYWHSKDIVKERDQRKNALLKENGYTLFRFTDKEINKDVKECIDKVRKWKKKNGC